MADKSLFEHILSGEIPSHKVGSGEGWYAFLDIFPRREGHTLVIPTTAVSRIVVHDGPLAGQEVAHVHIHVLPRTENDSGKTLAAMWPHQSHEIDHEKLRVLASELQMEGE